MAVTKEIWINDIVNTVFADDTFAARSVNHSAFVNNKTVHVPNAGAAPSVTKGRSSFPATVSTRTDVDLYYNINEFTTDPIRVPAAEQVELSYDKRASVLSQCRSALSNAACDDLLYSWADGITNKVVTIGEKVAAHVASATGYRNAITVADILSVKTMFDKDDIPQTGRCIILDAVMYNQLLIALTDAQAVAFVAGADPLKGVVGQFMGFDFYMRSSVLRTTSAGAVKNTTGAATDCGAGLAWQEDCVSRAIGETDMFESSKDPLYYGDVIDFLVRAGGKYIRNDKKGVAVIYQGTYSE